MKRLKERLPGVLLALLVAAPAYLIGKRVPIVGGPVLGILLGMLLAFVRRPKALDPGIAYTSKKLLQYSIVLIGFDMNLHRVVAVGGQTLVLMAFTLLATFLAAYLLGRLLRVEPSANILIGVGTAICGGSAIAAAAPVIDARDEDVARSISTIFLFNVAAAFLFPFLGHLMRMSAEAFGLWAGTAINDTSSVVAAGYAFADEAGDLAVIVKLTRSLLIVPVTLALALISSKRKSGGQAKYRFARIFPWFVLGFVAASVLSTYLPIPAQAVKFLVSAGKYGIVMAMAAIGLNTNLVRLVKNGWRPILLGFGCWATLAAVSLLAQRALGMG